MQQNNENIFQIGMSGTSICLGVLYITVAIKIGINFTGKHGIRFHGI